MKKIKLGSAIFYIIGGISLFLFVLMLFNSDNFSLFKQQMRVVLKLIFLINAILFLFVGVALKRTFFEIHDQLDDLKLRVIRIERKADGKNVDF